MLFFMEIQDSVQGHLYIGTVKTNLKAFLSFKSALQTDYHFKNGLNINYIALQTV
jgi:hypothetical protein